MPHTAMIIITSDDFVPFIFVVLIVNTFSEYPTLSSTLYVAIPNALGDRVCISCDSCLNKCWLLHSRLSRKESCVECETLDVLKCLEGRLKFSKEEDHTCHC